MYYKSKRQQYLPHYHGHYHGHDDGFCHSCCHPMARCCCGCRECRKEAKEILVRPPEGVVTYNPPDLSTGTIVGTVTTVAPTTPSLHRETPNPTLGDEGNVDNSEGGSNVSKDAEIGDTIAPSPTSLSSGLMINIAGSAIARDSAIIGGGCCVHLSIEYMPANPTISNVSSKIVVKVIDSEATGLEWSKEGVLSGYHIKERIITTNPGAKLTVGVVNAIARVRWCEVFSC